MKADETVTALSALAHGNRLAIYRMLVQAGPAGLSAGAIAARLAVPPSSLTFHLHRLRHAKLVTRLRVSRQQMYAADFAMMNCLVGFLTENCCGGSGICTPAGQPGVPRRKHG